MGDAEEMPAGSERAASAAEDEGEEGKGLDYSAAAKVVDMLQTLGLNKYARIFLRQVRGPAPCLVGHKPVSYNNEDAGRHDAPFDRPCRRAHR